MRSPLSKKYIYGTGLEIAAFHNPWPVHGTTQVIYLDALTNPQLRKLFPEVNHKAVVDVQVIDDANYLKVIPDESMDFVMSSHVLEHMENPGIALKHWLRVLKKNKFLLMAVPLKHNYIDQGRVPTSTEHVLKEFLNPEQYDLEQHYREYFSDSVDRLTGDALENAIQASVETRYNVHFHCWDMKGLVASIHLLSDYLHYRVYEILEGGHEAFVVLKKE